jgi:hypothetical protein
MALIRLIQDRTSYRESHLSVTSTRPGGPGTFITKAAPGQEEVATMAIANEAPPTDVRGLEDHFKDKPDAGIERFGIWRGPNAAQEAGGVM